MHDLLVEVLKEYKFFNWNKKGRTPVHKERITRYNMYNMLRRTLRMFRWKGLPKEIPQRFLELVIQTRGFIGIYEREGKLYSSWGTLGGTPNYNYMPSTFIVSNPHFKGGSFSREFNVYGENKDVVIIPNDSLYIGLLPILGFHSELNTEIQLTKRAIVINERMPNVLTAPDNNAKKDIDDFIGDLEDGELASIVDKNFMRKVESLPYGEGRSANLTTQIIEMEQYELARLFNDLGLQSNYNMKRETLTSSENMLNIDALLPLCDDMLEMRKERAKEVNELFGHLLEEEVDVEFDSSWKMLRDNLKLEKLKSAKEVVSGNSGNSQSTEETTDDTKEEVQSTEETTDDTKEEVQSTEENVRGPQGVPDPEGPDKIIEDIVEDILESEKEEGDNNEESV